MKRRLAVILMADMVDYTAAMEADQAGTVGLIRELRERWLEPEAERRGGEVLKRMGDGWIITFVSITDAVETAQSVQTALSSHDKIRLRVAAHLGEIVEDEADLYGSGINITARLQSEAPPGGVMISEDLHRQLDTKLAEAFGDAGAFTLKNISRPVTGYQWRPEVTGRRRKEDLPVIGVEPVSVLPDNTDTRDAAADLREQLVHSLGRRTGIRVMVVDGAPPETEDGPTYRLRGRLRVRGDTARVALSIIVTETGRLSWSNSYEGPADDLLGLSDGAATQADIDIRLAINAGDNDRLAHLPDEALSVSELRARAAGTAYRMTLEDYRHSVLLIERALRLSPTDPMSLAMWAEFRLFELLAQFREIDEDVAARLATACDSAVQALPRSDYVYSTRAFIRTAVTRNFAGARRDLDRGEQINPGYIYFDFYRGWLELVSGAPGEALRVLKARWLERRQDTTWYMVSYLAAIGAILDHQYAEAVAILEDAIEARPACKAYHTLLAEAWSGAGDEAKAEAVRRATAGIPYLPDIVAPRVELPGAGAALIEKLTPTQG